MKKYLISFILLITVIFNLLSLEVAVDELKAGGKKIEFINYRGRHRYADSIFSIRGIGQRLAGIKDDEEVFKYLMKYSIIRAYQDTTDDRYGADIISIDKDARVDHINNVRAIIGSYLERKYGYKNDDAFILATFITYYNAVYRGDMDYFSKKYKDVVLKYITKENVGIAVRYSEWPGETKIVIPLTEKAAGENISALDTTLLTEDKVIEQLKKKEDMGVDERKKITDVKEKEVVEAKKEIVEEKKKIEDAKQDVAKKEEAIQKDKTEIAKKEEVIQKDKEEAKKITDPVVREKKTAEIKKEEEKVAVKKEEIKKEEAKVDLIKTEAAKKESAVKKAEDKVVKKEAEIKKDVAEIKKDEAKVAVKEEIKKEPQKVAAALEKKSDELAMKEAELKKKEQELSLKKEDPNIFQDKFYYLKIKEYMSEGHYNNEMFVIDAASRKILIKSPLKNICGSKYDIFKEGVVVISFESDHKSNHSLTLLDLNTLAVKKTGKDNIFWRSFVEVKEDMIYAVIKDGEKYFLGKFNAEMTRTAISNEEVDSSTFLTFYKDFIYINNPKKEVVVLKKNDLSFVDKIKPE